MKRILISGYHGFGNCGDEAILISMVNNLKSSYPDMEIVALSKDPEETSRVYGIKSISRINVFSIIWQFLRTNLLISGGGSLLQDVTSTRSLIYYLGIITLAKLMFRPVMIYANGIGPIKRPFNRLLTSIILNMVNIITLRDEDSLVLLRNMGVNRPEIIVTADPVFTLTAEDDNKVEEILSREGIDRDKPLLGVSIRKWGSSKTEMLIADAIDGLVKNYNYNVVFIPMHVPNDVETIKRVQKMMKFKSYALKGNYSVREYMGLIGKLDMLISMRLHTLIFAAVQNIPMIGIVYDPKVQSILDLVDQPSAGDVARFDKYKLYSLVDDIIVNREDVRKRLEKRIKDLKEKATLNDNIVISLLEKRKGWWKK